MKQRTVTVSSNLEARTTAMFVQTAGKFQSNIRIRLDDKEVNAKSIMGMISLGIFEGNTITIIAEGVDEDRAVNETGNFFIAG